jgi:hypothetical protein
LTFLQVSAQLFDLLVLLFDLHNALSALASSRRLCNRDEAVSGASGTAQDVDASASCAGPCDITQSSNHTTSTSSAGPEVG